MVNIVRAILGLNEDDGKEIAKAVKQVKKKEKKEKKQKKAKAKKPDPKPEPAVKKSESIKPIMTKGEKAKSEVEPDAE